MKLPGTVKPVEHTADVGLRFEARSLSSLFETAGMAMVRMMVPGLDSAPAESRLLVVQGMDYESLLINYLNELLYLFQEQGRAAVGIRVLNLTEENLHAEVESVPFHADRYTVETDIKAATYHEINILEENGMWSVTVIFDV